MLLGDKEPLRNDLPNQIDCGHIWASKILFLCWYSFHDDPQGWCSWDIRFHWKILALVGIWTRELPGNKLICYQLSYHGLETLLPIIQSFSLRINATYHTHSKFQTFLSARLRSRISLKTLSSSLKWDSTSDLNLYFQYTLSLSFDLSLACSTTHSCDSLTKTA